MTYRYHRPIRKFIAGFAVTAAVPETEAGA
ncbi:hypothetical protein H4W34_006406 [Actinomadura algeriensis]|uniref:Uncharacterized protein n=1 Tax=Actinomadura algeriensis TaxID=1679523 RepID=A0ABR9K158_9ACTN|nr:hypothetical protein [Actinomadura algeriensis]